LTGQGGLEDADVEGGCREDSPKKIKKMRHRMEKTNKRKKKRSFGWGGGPKGS